MNSGQIRDESQQVKMIDFFGIKISLNAYIILMAGLIMCIIMMFIGPYGPLIGIVAFLFVILSAYNVNCTLIGHCKVWAWFLTVFYIIYAIIVVMSMYLKYKKGDMSNSGVLMPQSIKKSFKKSSASK
jgi:hypothetical protein